MFCSLEELAMAMINSLLVGSNKKVLESKDISELGRKKR